MAVTKKKATKEKQKVKILLYGVSGSGKSRTAQEIAKRVQSDPNKVSIVDTENESSSLYVPEVWGKGAEELVDLYSFAAPYKPQELVEVLNLIQKNKSADEVIIVDGISLFWDGKGGILDFVDGISGGEQSKNQQAWGSAKPLVRNIIEAITGCKCHLIVTARSKGEPVTEEYLDKRTNRVKTKRTIVGMQPIFKDGLEYEFHLSLEMGLVTNMDGTDSQVIKTPKPPKCEALHNFKASIDGRIEGMPKLNIDELTQTYLTWINEGADPTVLSYRNGIKVLAAKYKDITGNEYPLPDLNTLSLDELNELGKTLKAANDDAMTPQ